AGLSSDEGSFDLTTLEDLEVEMIKKGVKIAGSTDFSYGIDGNITGRFEAVEGSSASYQNEYYKVTVDDLSIGVTYNLIEGFSIDGAISGKLSEMRGLDGEIAFTAQYLPDEVITNITTGDLSAFGMEISKLELNAAFSRKLELESLTGNFSAKHPRFSAALAVSAFSFTNDGLQIFEASADFSYNYNGTDIEFLVTRCSYDAAIRKIVLDAMAKTSDPENGKELVVAVKDFTIDTEGNITIGEITAESVADLVMGPVIVTSLKVQNKAGTTGEAVDNKQTRRFVGTGSALIKAIKPDGEVVSIELGEIKIDYNRFDEVNDQSFISGYLEWQGDQEFLNVWGIAGKLTKAEIWVDQNGKVRGAMAMSASGKEDQVVGGVFLLKAGLTGEMKYVFQNQKNFTGNFDLKGLSNINLALVKNGTEVAAIQNGSFSEERIFSGTLTASPGAKFESKGFNLTLDNLSLSASYSFETNKVRFNSGEGQITVSEIAGLKNGTIALSLEALENDILRTGVTTTETAIEAFGFSVSPGSLRAEITPELELVRVYGDQLKAEHQSFDSEVNIEEFIIAEGKLTKLKAYGDVVYKGFDFSIEDVLYEENELTVDASILLNLTGTQGYFAVDDFTINETGAVSISGIEGSLTKGNLYDIDFDATFRETQFKGNFKGDINPIGLAIEGSLDIGKERTGNTPYHYAYLNLKAGVGKGLPLGPTGLKLDKIGGKAGFNYRLSYNTASQNFTGAPKKGNYLLGLTMAVSDLTNSISVEGSPTIQFSKNTFDFNLEGEVSIPKDKPLIQSNVRLQYSYPASSLYGDFTTSMKLPASSGSIFNATIPVNFKIDKGVWEVSGRNINGQLLKLVNFDGSFLFDGKVDPFRVNNVRLSGNLDFQYKRDFTLEALGAFKVGLAVDANFHANANVEVNESGMAGEFTGRVTSTIEADARLLFINLGVRTTADASATVGYSSEKGGYMNAQG
ncbi:MAG: hypothetical protein WBA74_24495, partial [Cyclobacteriaceae bacterium]